MATMPDISVELQTNDNRSFLFSAAKVTSSPLISSSSNLDITGDDIEADFTSFVTVSSIFISSPPNFRSLPLNSGQTAPLLMVGLHKTALRVNVVDCSSTVQIFDNDRTFISESRFGLQIGNVENFAIVSIEPVSDQSDLNFVCFGARNLLKIWISHRGNAIAFIQSV
jgi:hypothetical protein